MTKIQGKYMISKKILITLAAVGVISTSAFGAQNYIGIKYAPLNMSKTVVVDKTGTTGPNQYVSYSDVELVGLEYQLLRNLESNMLMWGLGVEVLFNDGSFLDGGTAMLDFKLGIHYKDLNAYGLFGGGIQSLSSYTVAPGTVYGIGVNYNVFKHMGVKIEYRQHSLTTASNTTSNGVTESNAYKLSGLMAGVSYKF